VTSCSVYILELLTHLSKNIADRFGIPYVNKNDIIHGLASWAKIASPWGKLSALASHPTKK
jgi:hypothetical protein